MFFVTAALRALREDAAAHIRRIDANHAEHHRVLNQQRVCRGYQLLHDERTVGDGVSLAVSVYVQVRQDVAKVLLDLREGGASAGEAPR